jgi:hypothetical protein
MPGFSACLKSSCSSRIRFRNIDRLFFPAGIKNNINLYISIKLFYFYLTLKDFTMLRTVIIDDEDHIYPQ